MHRPSLGDNSCPPRTVRGLLPEALRTMTLSYVSDLGPGVGALPPRARLASDAPRLDLDGTWRFRLVPTLDDVTEGLEPRGFDTSGWDEIPVPSSWQMIDIAGAAPVRQACLPQLPLPFPIDVPHPPEANPTGEYVRTFTLPDKRVGRASRGGTRGHASRSAEPQEGPRCFRQPSTPTPSVVCDSHCTWMVRPARPVARNTGPGVTRAPRDRCVGAVRLSSARTSCCPSSSNWLEPTRRILRRGLTRLRV